MELHPGWLASGQQLLQIAMPKRQAGVTVYSIVRGDKVVEFFVDQRATGGRLLETTGPYQTVAAAFDHADQISTIYLTAQTRESHTMIACDADK